MLIVAPAPVIPKDTEDGPLQSIQKMQKSILKMNSILQSIFSPNRLVIRGVDAAIIGITPFQYNPVTKGTDRLQRSAE
jgi:hypothetical protein